MSAPLIDPTQPLPYASVPGQQPAPAAPAPGLPAVAPAPAPSGAFGQQMQILQELQRQQAGLASRIPGMVGAEMGALNELARLYQQPQRGPDPALLQLAAGFFAPTRTGGVGESIATATNSYAGALSKQREQDFDRATKLAQLKLTQAQLASKIPQMQMEALSGQAKTLGEMSQLEKMQRDAQETARQRAAFEEFLRTNSGDYTPEQLAELNATPADKRAERMAQMRRDSQLTDKGIETFTTLGKDLETATNLSKSFKDSYSGKGIGPIGTIKGNLENLAGRQGKDSAWNADKDGADRVGQAEWWMKYQGWKSKVRNELYGAALTPGERADFDRQEVSPADGPDVVRNKLAAQQEIVRSAIARTRDSYTSQGKSRKAIDSALGPYWTGNQGGGNVPEAPRDPTQRKAGTKYMTPKGPLTWNGSGWEVD